MAKGVREGEKEKHGCRQQTGVEGSVEQNR